MKKRVTRKDIEALLEEKGLSDKLTVARGQFDNEYFIATIGKTETTITERISDILPPRELEGWLRACIKGMEFQRGLTQIYASDGKSV